MLKNMSVCYVISFTVFTWSRGANKTTLRDLSCCVALFCTLHNSLGVVIVINTKPRLNLHNYANPSTTPNGRQQNNACRAELGRCPLSIEVKQEST